MPCYPCPVPKEGEEFPHYWACASSEPAAALDLADHLVEAHWNAPGIGGSQLDVDLSAELRAYVDKLNVALEADINLRSDLEKETLTR
jgi:hypothetical protein